MRLLYCGIALAFCVLLCAPEIQANARLIGIWNNLTPASNKPVAGEKIENSEKPTVLFQDQTAAVGTPLSIPGGKQLPVRLTITNFADPKNNCSIDIKEERRCSSTSDTNCCKRACGIDKVCVTATVDTGDVDSTCVSTAVYSFNKPGNRPFQWQNVMFFLADNDQYDPDPKSHTLPFKFGISSWTSTNGIWKNDKLKYAPADPKGSPKVDFKQPLWVFQGNSAWGGGPIPRMHHGCIAHIYNNTGYVVMVRRNWPVNLKNRLQDLHQYNFEKLIPPYSVVPFAMVWPSKIDESLKDKVDGRPVQFILMGISKSSSSLRQLAPIDIPGAIGITADQADQLGLSTENTMELSLSDQQIGDIATAILQNMSVMAQDISGANKWLDALKADETQKYLTGKNTYKIFSTTDPNNTIYIKECSISTGDEKIISTHKTPAFNATTGMPNFTRLIINEKNKKISFDLTDISLDAVYEESK